MSKSSFFSHQTYENKLEFSPVSSYSRYHYAVLKCRGISELFDLLRYDRAFLVRQSDMERIADLFNDELKSMMTPLEIVIASYGWSAKPQWTYNRLLSNMSITELKINEIMRLECDFSAFEANPKLKLRSDINITGSSRDVLRVMYQNQAMPCREEDARRIEHMPFSESETDCVRLTRFVPNEREWRL